MKLKKGDVVEFHYSQSEPDKIRLGKIHRIRDTETDPLDPRSMRYAQALRRSRYLLTLVMADGTYRNFYDCALTNLHKVGMIRRTLLRLSGVRFEKPSESQSFET